LRTATQREIERLGVGRLDLTQLHCVPTGVLRAGHVCDWLREMRAEGLITRFSNRLDQNCNTLDGNSSIYRAIELSIAKFQFGDHCHVFARSHGDVLDRGFGIKSFKSDKLIER
jgi:hypothetical protein